MADPPDPGEGNDIGVAPDSRRISGMPRWVKASVIIIVVLVVAFVILKLTGIAPDHGGNGSGHFGNG